MLRLVHVVFGQQQLAHLTKPSSNMENQAQHGLKHSQNAPKRAKNHPKPTIFMEIQLFSSDFRQFRGRPLAPGRQVQAVRLRDLVVQVCVQATGRFGRGQARLGLRLLVDYITYITLTFFLYIFIICSIYDLFNTYS